MCEHANSEDKIITADLSVDLHPSEIAVESCEWVREITVR
jgi:hypothetical protein